MPDHPVPRSMHDFQLRVTDSLGRLETGQEAVKERLQAITDSVAEHTRRLGDIDERNAARIYGCHLLKDIEKLVDGLRNQISNVQSGAEKDRAVSKAATNGLHDQVENLQSGAEKDRAVSKAVQDLSERWYNRAKPLIYLAVVVFIGVVLGLHGADIVKLILKGG